MSLSGSNPGHDVLSSCPTSGMQFPECSVTPGVTSLLSYRAVSPLPLSAPYHGVGLVQQYSLPDFLAQSPFLTELIYVLSASLPAALFLGDCDMWCADKLDACMEGTTAFTLVLDDPAGNSYIESSAGADVAASKDLLLKLERYERTPEQV